MRAPRLITGTSSNSVIRARAAVTLMISSGDSVTIASVNGPGVARCVTTGLSFGISSSSFCSTASRESPVDANQRARFTAALIRGPSFQPAAMRFRALFSLLLFFGSDAPRVGAEAGSSMSVHEFTTGLEKNKPEENPIQRKQHCLPIILFACQSHARPTPPLVRSAHFPLRLGVPALVWNESFCGRLSIERPDLTPGICFRLVCDPGGRLARTSPVRRQRRDARCHDFAPTGDHDEPTPERSASRDDRGVQPKQSGQRRTHPGGSRSR